MKKIIMLFIFIIPMNLFSNDIRFSINGSYYTEPLAKPGITISPEIYIDLDEKNRLSISIPSITYFYFPDSHNSLSIYPEVCYSFTPTKHLFLGLSGGYGLSLTKIIVPIYNSYGVEIDGDLIIQGIMKAGINIGYTSKDFDIYGSIGWKGLHPYNLGIKHQAYLQLGYRRYLNEKN